MKKYNAVIFDLDGVICHTDKYHYQAWKAVADELGIYFDEEINNRLRGVSRMESFEIILDRYEGEMSEEVFVKAAEYVDEQADKCLVVEDAKAGLQAAIAGGMDCAAIGDAVASGLGTYNLSAFADLLKVTAK